MQNFKQYIANNIVNASDISEKNINVNSFMESLEELSKDKLKDKKKIIHDIHNQPDEDLKLLKKNK